MSKNSDKPLVAITDHWGNPLVHTEIAEAREGNVPNVSNSLFQSILSSG